MARVVRNRDVLTRALFLLLAASPGPFKSSLVQARHRSFDDDNDEIRLSKTELYDRLYLGATGVQTRPRPLEEVSDRAAGVIDKDGGSGAHRHKVVRCPDGAKADGDDETAVGCAHFAQDNSLLMAADNEHGGDQEEPSSRHADPKRRASLPPEVSAHYGIDVNLLVATLDEQDAKIRRLEKLLAEQKQEQQSAGCGEGSSSSSHSSSHNISSSSSFRSSSSRRSSSEKGADNDATQGRGGGLEDPQDLNSVGGVGAPPASAPTTNFLEGVIEVQTKRIEDQRQQLQAKETAWSSALWTTRAKLEQSTSMLHQCLLSGDGEEAHDRKVVVPGGGGGSSSSNSNSHKRQGKTNEHRRLTASSSSTEFSSSLLPPALAYSAATKEALEVLDSEVLLDHHLKTDLRTATTFGGEGYLEDGSSFSEARRRRGGGGGAHEKEGAEQLAEIRPPLTRKEERQMKRKEERKLERRRIRRVEQGGGRGGGSSSISGSGSVSSDSENSMLSMHIRSNSGGTEATFSLPPSSSYSSSSDKDRNGSYSEDSSSSGSSGGGGSDKPYLQRSKEHPSLRGGRRREEEEEREEEDDQHQADGGSQSESQEILPTRGADLKQPWHYLRERARRDVIGTQNSD